MILCILSTGQSCLQQNEIEIRETINNLEKEEKPYEEIINSEFSTIQENKNNEFSPRSHG